MVPSRFADVLRAPTVRAELLADDGTYPNNERLPLIVYEEALAPGVVAPAQALEQIVRAHDWRGTWRNGIFGYHHYHSTSHEVLGVARGEAAVQLGGPSGPRMKVSAGDVLILPAGVAHENGGAQGDFLVVGAYPQGRNWDLKTGAPGDRPEADRNIEAVPLPAHDPIYGAEGPLLEHWSVPAE
ncbi:MAG: cupin domain-containing protein [Salinibacter sp.]